MAIAIGARLVCIYLFVFHGHHIVDIIEPVVEIIIFGIIGTISTAEVTIILGAFITDTTLVASGVAKTEICSCARYNETIDDP